MTVQEARKQVGDAENKVNSEFSDMKSSAYSMAQAAQSEASSNTQAKTWIPLIACLIGVICCCAGSPGWGIFLIIVGAVVAYNMHGSAKSGENQVSNLARNLSNQLDQYPKI